MGLATDAISRLALPPDQAKALLDAMPTAYAVSYIFGTIGSALILATLGPKLLRIDLVAACKEYEASLGGTKEMGGAGQAWHRYELRAYRVKPESVVCGKTVNQVEALQPEGMRLFIERVRRGSVIHEAGLDFALQPDDVVAIAGPRDQLVSVFGTGSANEDNGGDQIVSVRKARAEEVDDPELLAVPAEGVDVYVTSKAVDGKTLQELANSPLARGVYLRKIKRGPTETQIPILPSTKLHRGDTITIVGRTQDTT